MITFRTPQQQLAEIASSPEAEFINSVVSDVIQPSHPRYQFALAVVMSLIKRHPNCSHSFATEHLIYRLEAAEDDDE